MVRAVSGLMLMTLRKLRDCKDIGMQSESGWKPQVWHLCAEALKAALAVSRLPKRLRTEFSAAFHVCCI